MSIVHAVELGNANDGQLSVAAHRVARLGDDRGLGHIERRVRVPERDHRLPGAYEEAIQSSTKSTALVTVKTGVHSAHAAVGSSAATPVRARRKRCKAHFSAPPFVRRQIISFALFQESRQRYNARSIPTRKDDEVSQGQDNSNGTTTSLGIHPSNVVITSLKLDEDCTAILDRKDRKKTLRAVCEQGCHVLA
ncbi:hypothetical protein EXIGLDRAFT_762211 [Exidia glandulosa HHB12029]|uniref:Uncharacterized protein n=1 Tax=Exidia glandulosa HHB12029 TaxID=1314781 RepID=A0A165MXT1_EXIGL|nr:hypothetical protein EXIGLDRAFT_762211 [Exidia glandulosa HHB12029]